MSIEQVVLLADDGTPTGVADKAVVHDANTPLHLAFSCHVYNARGQLLVTRRSLNKLTWPGAWTNSFCGHPGPDEESVDAVARRAERELGITVQSLTLALPDFRYWAKDASGVVENEICPVYTATTADTVMPAADEVMAFEWVDPQALLTAVNATPWAFSPWLTLQLPLLLSE